MINGNSHRVPNKDDESSTADSQQETVTSNQYRKETDRAAIAWSRAISDFKVGVVRETFPLVLLFLLMGGIFSMGFVLLSIVALSIHYLGLPEWRWLAASEIARLEGIAVGIAMAFMSFVGNKFRQG